MKPIKFKSANAVLNAPPNWDEATHGACDVLHIARAHDCIYSCWKPSFKERVQIIFGKPITLVVAQPVTMPPVALSVGEP